MNAVDQFPGNYLVWTLFGAAVAHSIWRLWLRSKSPSHTGFEIVRGKTHNRPTKAPFSRRDFIAKAEPVRKEMVKGFMTALVVLIAAGPALAIISWLVPTLPREFFITALTVLFTAGIGSMIAFGMRGSRMMRTSGLICPACEMELLGTHQKHSSRQNRILETGKCPAAVRNYSIRPRPE